LHAGFQAARRGGNADPFDRWRAVMEQTCGQRLPSIAAQAGRLVKTFALHDADPLDALFAVQSYYALVVAETAAAMAPAFREPLLQSMPWFTADGRPLACIDGVAASIRELTSGYAADRAAAEPAGDMFKQFHHDLFARPLRHAMGEYYTPDWLAARLLDDVGFVGRRDQRLLDPTCGSGTFLVQAIHRIAQANHDVDPADLLRTILGNVAGIELSPLAAVTARANYLIALGPLLEAAPFGALPIGQCDAILDRPVGAAFERPFDVVVGNPPWIAWDNLPADYREATRTLWEQYGLFSLSASAARHGGGKKDLAMLMFYIAAERYLAMGGRLGMVLTQTLLQTKGAGDGFRRFQIGADGPSLRVMRADDYVAARPFDAANWTCTLVVEKGLATQYPLPYFRWSADAQHAEAMQARPIDAARPASPWLVQSVGARDMRELTGPSDYRAYLGANSGGANGVYWVDILGMQEGLVRIRPTLSADEAPRAAAEWLVESELLYPLLRWDDVDRFRSRLDSGPADRGTTRAIVMTQDPATRTGINELLFAARWPRTLAYLRQFESKLRRRAAYRRYQAAGPFYSMYNVGPYTYRPLKVVWRRMDKRLRAVVVDERQCPLLGRRAIVPQETCVFIPCDSLDEAHYLAALLNSRPVGSLVAAHSVAGGKGFGTPSILDYLALRRYDATHPDHQTLSSLSRQAHNGGTLTEIELAIDEAVERMQAR
jgi:hypothetical protein